MKNIFLLGWSHGQYEDAREGVICASHDRERLEDIKQKFEKWLARKKDQIPPRADDEASLDEWTIANERRTAFLRVIKEPFPYAKHCIEYGDSPDFSVYPVPLK